MTRRYWQRVGGTLVEEFLMVPRRRNVGRRLADGLIILDGEHRRLTSAEVTLDGKDVIVVQTKANRLGMYLLGQALFSRELISDLFNPSSIRTLALCQVDDAVLRPIAERHRIDVVVDDSVPESAANEDQLDD